MDLANTFYWIWWTMNEQRAMKRIYGLICFFTTISTFRAKQIERKRNCHLAWNQMRMPYKIICEKKISSKIDAHWMVWHIFEKKFFIICMYNVYSTIAQMFCIFSFVKQFVLHALSTNIWFYFYFFIQNYIAPQIHHIVQHFMTLICGTAAVKRINFTDLYII